MQEKTAAPHAIEGAQRQWKSLSNCNGCQLKPRLELTCPPLNLNREIQGKVEL